MDSKESRKGEVEQVDKENVMPALTQVSMKCVGRNCLNTPYHEEKRPVPDVPKGGARVKVSYAGACFTESQLATTGRKRPKLEGIDDGSLYPGYEVSGVVDKICPSVASDQNLQIKVGDKVVIYPEKTTEEGNVYAEYVAVNSVKNLVRVPEGMDMKVACLLPCGGLTAYSTVTWLKPHIQAMIEDKQDSGNPVRLLINGAGALGLWTCAICTAVLPQDSTKLRIIIADASIDKLEVAKRYGVTDVIHWDNRIYEEYMVERTQNVCGPGVDIVIDYSSTPRSISRALKVMAEGGILVVGGNSGYDCTIDVADIASKQQTIKGVGRGRRHQLDELVELYANGRASSPKVVVYPVEEVNEVFESMEQCCIKGRPVLSLCP